MTTTTKQKVALVTGGARGMGADIARRLAADGMAVVITFSASKVKAEEVVDAITASGGTALSIQADSGKPADVKAAIARTIEVFGRLDVLVNNAGIAIAGAPDDYSEDDFDRMVDVNVKGVFVAAQAAAPHLPQGGRIINIGSCMSNYAAFPGMAVYTMTKSAVAGLTRGLARDLAPRGITVNNVQPGPVDTDMNPADGEMAKHIIGHLPLGRYGKGNEIAALVSFLAREESGFITGANILADGGMTA